MLYVQNLVTMLMLYVLRTAEKAGRSWGGRKGGKEGDEGRERQRPVRHRRTSRR